MANIAYKINTDYCAYIPDNCRQVRLLGVIGGQRFEVAVVLSPGGLSSGDVGYFRVIVVKGSIRQRNPGSWELQVFLGRDSSGKRIRKTETVRGKKADAERRLREMLTDLDHGITLPQKSYKLEEWLDQWMTDVIIPNRRQKTVDRYEGVIRLHLVPHLGHLELSKITPVHVQRLEGYLRTEGGMSPKGVQMVHNVLGGALRHAAKMELISRNPVASVSPPPLEKKEAFSPVVASVRRLLAHAEADGHHLWPCLHLLAYTGLRRGEALALEWTRVNLDKQLMTVAASLVTTARGILVEQPKTSSGQRVVDLDSRTVEILRDHRKRQEKDAQALRMPPPSVVFPRNGLEGWCHPNTLSNTLERLAKKAGCPEVTARSLRHFHATVSLQASQNVVVVSKRLGHSKVSITLDIYAHALPGWQKEVAEAFAREMDQES